MKKKHRRDGSGNERVQEECERSQRLNLLYDKSVCIFIYA